MYTEPVILETDCANLTKDTRTTTRPAWFHHVSDIRVAMLSFSYVQVSCVGRGSNILAHELVAYARQKMNQVTIGTVSEELVMCMKNDCNLILE